MYKVGVVGEEDVVRFFNALGMDVFSTEDPQEAEKVIRHVAGDYAVIFLTESIASAIGAAMDEYRTAPLPAVVIIPGSRGPRGVAMEWLKKSVIKAVGANVLDVEG